MVLEHIVRVLDETSPGQGFQIEVMISDFEPAILHAVKQTFPGNEKGCWFHFGQVSDFLKYIRCQIVNY